MDQAKEQFKKMVNVKKNIPINELMKMAGNKKWGKMIKKSIILLLMVI